MATNVEHGHVIRSNVRATPHHIGPTSQPHYPLPLLFFVDAAHENQDQNTGVHGTVKGPAHETVPTSTATDHKEMLRKHGTYTEN